MSNGNVLGRFGEMVCVVTKALVKIWPEIEERSKYWIGNPARLEEVLRRVLVQTTSCIVATYELVMNWATDLDDAIKKAKFDRVNENITQANFSATEFDVGNTKKQFGLFHFNRTILSEDAIIQMKAEGYRPATMLEGILWSNKNPKRQLEFMIVLLGQVARFGDDDRVGFLRQGGAERCLDLYPYYFVGGWRDDCRFLAVHI